MSLFKPVLVEKKTSLDSVTKVNGQYIIVVDTKEIYVDKADAEGNIVRVNASRSGIFIQAEEPTNAVEGDIWFQIEAYFYLVDNSEPSPQPQPHSYDGGMTWNDFIYSDSNKDNVFALDAHPLAGITVVMYKNAYSPDGCYVFDGDSYVQPTDTIRPETIYYTGN